MKHTLKPTLPMFLKHWSLKVLIGALLLAALVAYGAVRQEQSDRVQAQKDAQVAAQQKAKDEATQKQIQSLTAERDASCSYLKSLTLAKATKSLITVPTASGCQDPVKQ